MKYVRFGRLIPFLCAAALVTMPALSLADTQATEVTNFGDARSAEWTAGWQFSLSKQVVVTYLGMYDYAADGIVNDHTVTLWKNADKSAVTSATVAATSAKSYWHWTVLPSGVLLEPGTYTISATYPTNEDYSLSGTAATMAPGLTYEGARYSWTPGVMPEDKIDPWNDGFFGPNFQFRDPDPVPEPALIQLPLLLSLGGVAIWRRSRIHKHRS